MVTALYRRYRPEAFAEMIGQSQVTDPLMTALRTERIGHAYLFSGPRGCGKTTSARILARCLNCVEGPTDTPCGTCPSCVDLSRDGGGSLDVVEIDAASHGGVDDARELRERAVFAPARDRYKIFIIDEAHMVTPGGFNALLKIVEEPPPHVKFVFATTEPEKVIGTIRSRTHHYPFRLVAPAPLIEYVQSLCDSEGVKVEAGVLPLVIRAGGGSVRDTLSILDQLIAGSEGNKVSLDRASGLLGFTHTELLDEVVAAFGARDAAGAFTATDRVVQTGQDPRRFAEDLLQRLRDLIVVSATTVQGAAAVFRGVPEDQLQRMFEQAQAFGRGELSRIADTVSAALDRMAGATSPKLQLELMIARALLTTERHGTSATLPTATMPAPEPGAVPATAPPAQPEPSTPASLPVQRPAQHQQQTTVQQTTGQPASPQPTAARQGPPTAQPEVPHQPEASQPAQPTAPAAVQPAEPPTEMTAAEAMRAAREFLRTDTAGAATFGRPVTDVIGMMEDNGQAASQSSPAQASQSGASTPQAQAQSAQAPEGPPSEMTPGSSADVDVSFSDLEATWPELLEELLEGDRDAWNAVQGVVPLSLEGDLFGIAFRSRSDLEVFKSQGAGPLREVILGALGITVRYQPRDLPPGAKPPQGAPQGAATEAPATTTQPSASPREPQAAPASNEKISAGDSSDDPPAAPVSPESTRHSTPTEQSSPVPEPSTDRAAALGPVGAAPAWADYQPDEPAGDDGNPYADSNTDPYPAEPAPPASPAESSPVAPEESAPAEPAAEKSTQSAPAFTRYGESVVREVLGARFVGEKPFPADEGR